MTPLLVGILAIGFMAAAVKVPTLKHAHALIVRVRATGFLAREMWEGAQARRDRWPECLHRAKHDV